MDKALKLINFMLERSKEDRHGNGLLGQYEYKDGWRLCIDCYPEEFVWMVMDPKDEVEIKKSLSGEGQIVPGKIYCCREDMLEDCFDIGLRLVGGKAVMVIPYSYVRDMPTEYRTIDYHNNRVSVSGFTGMETRSSGKNLLNKKFKEFVDATVDHNMREAFE